jgi:hypothetical protein
LRQSLLLLQRWLVNSHPYKPLNAGKVSAAPILPILAYDSLRKIRRGVVEIAVVRFAENDGAHT